MPVNGVSSLNILSPTILQPDTTKQSEGSIVPVSFSEYLKGALDNVNDLQLESDKATEDFALGKSDNIHGVMIAAEKADVALQFAMQVRNKLLDAYTEIMRMQV